MEFWNIIYVVLAVLWIMMCIIATRLLHLYLKDPEFYESYLSGNKLTRLIWLFLRRREREIIQSNYTLYYKE